MTVTKKGKQGKATVSKEISGKVKSKVSEVVGDPVLDAPCSVGLSLGASVQVSESYWSKFEITLFMPCAEEDVEDRFEEVTEWVNKKAEAIMDEIQEEMSVGDED